MQTQTAIAIKPKGPGYDGEPPVMREPRDLEGRGKRNLEGRQNVNTDRLEWLYHHGKIEQYQLEAGRSLLKDWQQMQIGGYASPSGTGGARDWLAGYSLSDLKCDATKRYGDTRRALGPKTWKLLELIVLNNWDASRTAKAMGWDERSGVAAIDLALESLAKHYGTI